LWVLTRSYRRTDLLGRRQIKWILYGLYLGTAPIVVVLLAISAGQLPYGAVALAELSLVAEPLGFLVAIFGYRFLDIDPLVSATASYSILSVGVLAGILVAVPPVAAAAGAAVGVNQTSAQVALSLALAGAAFSVDRSLRPRIERLFFPGRQALEQGIEALLTELSNLRDPRDITLRTGFCMIAS
jgi:hypothetical protein